jgi:sugar phosphate isomerase/epimerase
MLSAAGAGVVGLSGMTRWAHAASGSLERIGVQLYTVRTLMEDDFEATLAAVADVGYHEVEFAGYFGRSPEQVKAVLEQTGLSAPACHVPIGALRDDLAGTIETVKTIGHEYMVCPWLAPEERGTIEGYRELATFFNEVGTACREAGVRFAYHNHDFEFFPIDGEVPMDVLLDGTDPDVVEFELDLFWITKGGRDPFEYFERYPGRFPLCHVKDMDEEEAMVDVGAGKIDFGSIFASSDQAGLIHYFVEHDSPPDPLASIGASFAHLESLRF